MVMQRQKQTDWKKRILFLVLGCSILCLLMLFTSCSAESQGDVLVVIKGSASTTNETDSAIASDIDTEIASYHISLYGPNSSSIKLERDLEADETETLFQTLPTGQWKLRVQAMNAEGNTVRSLCYDSSYSDRLAGFTIAKGKVTEINCTLVPCTSGEGTLSVSIDWTGVSDNLIPDESIVILSVVPLTDVEGLDEATVSNSGITSQSITSDDISLTINPDSSETISLDLTNVPSGLYEVSAEVQDEATTTRIWKGVKFARIMDTGTTTVAMTLLDTAIQVGSTNLSIDEDIAPLDVSFTSNPTELTYSNSVGVDGSVSGTFTVSTDSSVDLFNWYVNGDLATDEDTTDDPQSFTYTFSETGQYTITCVVIDSDNGNLGSAQCEVTVIPSEEEN